MAKRRSFGAKRRLADERGAVAMIFAASVIPALGLLGLGVDATLYLSGKERLDAWVEAACERVNSPPMLRLDEDRRWAAAEQIFQANSADVASGGETLGFRVRGEGEERVLEGDYDMGSLFGSIFGVDSYRAVSALDCVLKTFPGGGTITFIFIDRNGERAYEIISRGDFEITGHGGDAAYTHYLDIRVYEGGDRSGEPSERVRISNHGQSHTIPATESDVVIEVRPSFNDGQLGASQEDGEARVRVEDGVDTDFNDAYYEFRSADGSSAFDNPVDVPAGGGRFGGGDGGLGGAFGG